MVRYCWVVAAALLAVGPVAAGTWADALFTEKSKDFGSVPRGPELTYRFPIKNTTGKVVTISGARVSCNVCSSVSLLKTTLQPGEESAVVAKLFTSRFQGIKTIHIYVTFSQPQYDEVTLWFQANARDDIAMTPDTLAFGTMRRGAGSSKSTTISFYGAAGSQVVGVDSETNHVKASFEKVEDPKRISSEAVYRITAQVRDDLPVGKWYTDLWVRTNNAAMPRLRLPLTVEVVSPLSISPGAVALGEVKMGGTVERKVIVRGVDAFKIKEIQGADEQLEVKDSSDGSKQVHVLTVRLKASKAGDLSKTVRIITDLAEEGQIEFTAKGQIVP